MNRTSSASLVSGECQARVHWYQQVLRALAQMVRLRLHIANPGLESFLVDFQFSGQVTGTEIL